MRVREFTREPEALFWAIFFPVMLATGLGFAFRGGPESVLSVAATTPALASALSADAGLDVRETGDDEARALLRTGDVLLVASPADAGGVTLRYDDANPQARAARQRADVALQRAAGRVDPVTVTDDTATEAGSRYIDFLIPGLVGLGIMSNAVWGIGFSIVDARRRKLIKRLTATPMSRAHYLLSYLLWRMMLLVVEVGVPIGFGMVAFGVPVRGSWIDIALLCVLTSFAFSAMGVPIASRARTIEAVSGLMNLAVLPMWLLSGVFFSAERFPGALQPLIALLPLTAALEALRALMLQGASLASQAPQLATLSVWAAVCFVLALKLFRWR
jgi:ABC transporter DrrB family efflux protein